MNFELRTYTIYLSKKVVRTANFRLLVFRVSSIPLLVGLLGAGGGGLGAKPAILEDLAATPPRPKESKQSNGGKSGLKG